MANAETGYGALTIKLFTTAINLKKTKKRFKELWLRAYY
jgi:hypothetical protein